ncbi:ABC transporter [Brachyspira pilosicoli WesB]|uniref:ABC transporter n=1 Tax=Brachyspira pilosicoli WesB TaxID=1161918 RepID=K0JL27_BRAPL|nr:4Fe-4S cluster-binding domain-containing protein [Brachyspira pilosicoli]CCG56886.1 ABC transporter [Brachyspira pilosicoli WesB]
MDKNIEKIINDIVWWIPFKKLRNNIRNILFDIYNKIDFLNNFISNNIDSKINNNYNILYNSIRNSTPQAYIDVVEISLAYHCNLNCYSCMHFSQLASEKYYDIEVFEKDIKRLSELTNGLINTFHLMGGEPLLNKNCKDYFYILRKYFKNSSIWLVTNGVLLLKQDENFWLSCKNNNIEIHPTKYPINIDWDNIKKICLNYNIPLVFYNNENIIKESIKVDLDLSGNQDTFSQFMNCLGANNCIQLDNGKLFTCSISAYINYFNKYFNENIPITEYDYIDIYKVNNYNEILFFLSKPIPLCKYCNNINWKTIGEWKISTRSIDEYTDQTRPDQTRPDLIVICKEYIQFYNNLKIEKLQPMLHLKNVA